MCLGLGGGVGKAKGETLLYFEWKAKNLQIWESELKI